LAGRLTGTLNGRPVVIEASESGILLNVSSFRTAWAARRTVGSLFVVLQTLKQCGVSLRLGIAGFVTVEVLPRPGALARIVVPGLSRLT
jgi:hypothetical protein